jgi:hypothetical protein
MRRRDFGTQLGGGLPRAVGRRNGMRRSQHRLRGRGHGHVGNHVAFAPPPSNQKKSVT